MDFKKLHYDGISELPFLTREEEQELADIIQGDNSDEQKQAAVEKLVTHNIRLSLDEAYKFAKKCGIEAEDLIGDAHLGLVTAAWKYNPKKYKTRFTTYSRYWIRNGIFMSIYKSYPIRVPLHIAGQISRMKKIETENSDGEPITDKRWIKELEITSEALKKIRSVQNGWISLDSPCGTQITGESCHVRDFVADEKTEMPDANLNRQEDYAILHDALSELDEIARDIVVSHCMSDDKVKLKDLGKKYGVTGEYARQIKAKALKDLKKKIAIKRKRG